MTARVAAGWLSLLCVLGQALPLSHAQTSSSSSGPSPSDHAKTVGKATSAAAGRAPEAGAEAPRPGPPETPTEKRPLEPIAEATLAKLKSFLSRGDVALIESDNVGHLRQVSILTRVSAPASVLEQVLLQPEFYASLVPALSGTKLRPDDRPDRPPTPAKLYDWKIELPLVALKGTSRVVERRNAKGNLLGLDIATIAGDVKTARWRIDLHPTASDETVLAYYGYTQITDSNWFLRRLVEHARSLEHGIVLATGVVFGKAIKLRAEAATGRGTGKRPVVSDSSERTIELTDVLPGFDVAALDPLLTRGTVALIESLANGRLRQANLATYVYASSADFYRVISTPQKYEEFLPGLRRSKVIEDNGREAIYDLTIKVPVLPDIQYRTVMRREPEDARVRQVCISGDAEGSVYGWELLPLGPKKTLAIYSLNGQLRRQNWVLRQIITKEAFLEHGLNVSVALATIMAMRGRAEGWR